jgi:hypothetical protein
MKPASILCAAIVTLAALAFAANGAFAAVNYNSSKSNSGNKMAQPTTTCPTGQSWNATAKKCEAIDMAVKGSGVPKNTSITDGAAKGQANEVTATPLNNRQNVSGTTSTTTTTTTPAPTH